MGSSNKKKKEKKKDFQVTSPNRSTENFPDFRLQKAKLKVGKAKAKAANFTDTSFKSKCTYAPKVAQAGHMLTDHSHRRQPADSR